MSKTSDEIRKYNKEIVALKLISRNAFPWERTKIKKTISKIRNKITELKIKSIPRSDIND